MKASTSNYTRLIHKIDEFIRKYYLSQVVRGSIYLIASFFASYILITTAEYYGNFSPFIRTILFFGFLIFNGIIFLRLIIFPLLHFYRLGSIISHEKASEIIGQHFSPIKDKLLNTLQLKKQSDENPLQRELIEASINQKIIELKPIPFHSAIKIKENRKYLKYALPPLIILAFIGATAPAILSESTERLIKYDKKFLKKAPFEFVVLNKNMSIVQGEDFTLKIRMKGSEIPQDIYLEEGANTFKLEKEDILHFNFTFRNIQNSKKIRLKSGEFASDEYTIEVKKKPTLLNFEANLEYPSYINKRNETINNSGDLTIPEGTKINWRFDTENTNGVQVKIADKILSAKADRENRFQLSYKILNSTQFSVIPQNSQLKTSEAASYNINVIKDMAPHIQVIERPDSLNNRLIYFFGQASDDYGFSALKFKYRILNNSDPQKTISKSIAIDPSSLNCNFFHVWNVNDLQVKPGEQIEYYFEVFDNDGVNGAKASRSAIKTLKLATEAETEKKLEKSSHLVQSKTEQAIKQAAEVEREAKRLNQELINKRSLSFEEKKQVEQLLDKQKDLEKLINEIRHENKQNLNDRQNLKEQREDILRKQKEIEDLFNNVLDEKTKELLKNIQQLLEKNNKNQTQQELSKMQLDNKNLQKELDRILELYKQLEFDQKLTESIDKLNKLAEKQNQLKEQTEENKGNFSELNKQQTEIKQSFENIKKELKEVAEKNEALEKRNNFEIPAKEQKLIDELLEKSSKSLEDKSSKKASENQKQSAEEMKKLSQQLEQMQQQNEEAENNVNLQNLREILDNLLTSSFDQEKVMQALRNISTNDPIYVKLIQKQKDIKDNLKLVQDSLYALSKKVPQIESVVNKEIQEINRQIEEALNNLAERRTAEANRNQQYAMTSMNNLALMLSEVQASIQQMMKNAKPGGKGKQKSLSQLSKMQEELNKNMQKARQQMEQGKMGQAQQGKGQMSEQMARMAREQQMIRQALQEINRDLNKDGKGGLGNLDKLSKQMEQTEAELVNKRIQQETLTRQQEILSKLLDAEKAERERELDTQRESQQGKNQSVNYKIVLEEFKKIKQSEVELLKTVPPSLNSFYKLKVGDYFRILNTN